ncbi:hypothetical protein H4I96_04766 [Botrytis cinerea]
MSGNSMGSCPLGGSWWICLDQSPTFFGCCASDPCNGIGCPEEDLLPAGMGTAGGPDASSNDGSYWPNADCPNGGVCSTETPSSQDSATVTATGGSSRHNSNSKLPITAIIGSALGGVVVIVLVLLIIFCVQRYRKRTPLAGAVEPYYQPPPQDISMVKAISSPTVYEGSASDAKALRKDYRPVSEIPSSPPLSPAPPYQSAPQSPEFSNHHEIDSSILHEVESPYIQQKSFVSRPGTVELPDTSEDPFRASLPEVLKYTCTAQTPTFFGCCTSNPCNNKGCPESDLRAAGLGHGETGDEGSMNLGSYWPNVYCSSGIWWICSSKNPSFQGCCDIDPCSSNATNCPQSHLYPAAFRSVTTASNVAGSRSTTFQTGILPTATFPIPTISVTTPPGASTIDQFLSLEYSKFSKTASWNNTGYLTQSSLNYSNSGTESTTPSIFYLTASNIPSFTQIAPSGTILTNFSDSNNDSSSISTNPNIATVTSISTFTAVRISVYTVPYSSSESAYPSDSLPLLTTTSAPVANSPGSSTTADTKLIAWGATGGVAFILVFALVSWLIRSRNRAKKNNNKPIIASLSTRLPWKKTSREIPRISLSSYPFKGMAPSTSNSSEEASNETWSASLKDYQNMGLMDGSKIGMDNNSEPRNQKPAHLSGYESHYSRPFQSQDLPENQNSTSLGGGLDRNSFARRMVQGGWDAVDLQSGYVPRDTGNGWHGEHDMRR